MILVLKIKRLTLFQISTGQKIKKVFQTFFPVLKCFYLNSALLAIQ